MEPADIENHLLEKQEALCQKYNAKYIPTPLNGIIGVALETFTELGMPVNGLRHSGRTHDTCTWYIWAGEYSSKSDFFKPVHIDHLLEVCPQAVNYLGLAPGWRFLFDNKGYEDVCYDKELLSVIT
ncbi:hypothetical protein ACVW0P_000017 [Mucilaginibacter sp. UYNi724]